MNRPSPLACLNPPPCSCPRNPGQMMMSAAVGSSNFIVGDFLVIDPSSSPRFDERMTLKEDYDLTAQHLLAYGRVARHNRVAVEAKHYSNSGGAVALRGEFSKTVPNLREQYNIDILKHKWPGAIKKHALRGVNEVLFDWSMRSTVLGGKHNVTRPSAPAGYNDQGSGSDGDASGGGGGCAPPAVKRRTIMSFFGPKN